MAGERAQEATCSGAGEVEALLHDMRGPLTAIRGQCHMLERSMAGSTAAVGRLRVIDDEITRVVAAIEDARSALRGAPADELPRRVDVESLVREAARRHDGSALAAGVTLRVCSGEEAAPVECRPEELRRLLDNLLSNAIRHAPAGTPVTLACARSDRRVVIGIRDEGPGLAGSPGETATAPGWGLGLVIAGHIARRNGGLLRREQGGRGLGISVELPAGEAAA